MQGNISPGLDCVVAELNGLQFEEQHAADKNSKKDWSVNIKRLIEAKGHGRRQFFSGDNIITLVFLVIVLIFATSLNFFVFTYFCLGLLVVRIFEIIFEMKQHLLDRPLLHYLVLVGIPLQYIWDRYH